MKNQLFAAALAVALAAGCSNQTSQPASSAQPAVAGLTIIGAGSTFVYPFFSRAFDAYHQAHPDVTVNYQSIGSGGGIQQFTAQTVDFGATDVPMSGKELAAVHGGPAAVLQIPVAIGGVAIAYNVPGSPAHLHLSPAVLASIYLGKVSSWNDPAIAALNAGSTLPNLPIIVVHRADGSGTTYMFTDYLSRVSAEWKSTVGTAKTVKWPAPSSIGMKGTEGVAGQVENTAGAIGYVELAYVLQTKISYAALVNRAGTAVVPSIASVRAAAAAQPEVDAVKFSIVDAPGVHAYPIAGYTWVLLYKHYDNKPKELALCNLFHWVESDGQKLAKEIDYVDLPSAVAARSVAALGPCL